MDCLWRFETEMLSWIKGWYRRVLLCRWNSRGKRTRSLFRIMQRSMIVRNGCWSRVNLSHLYNQLSTLKSSSNLLLFEPSLSQFLITPLQHSFGGILYHRYRLMCITHIKPRRLKFSKFPISDYPKNRDDWCDNDRLVMAIGSGSEH